MLQITEKRIYFTKAQMHLSHKYTGRVMDKILDKYNFEEPGPNQLIFRSKLEKYIKFHKMTKTWENPSKTNRSNVVLILVVWVQEKWDWTRYGQRKKSGQRMDKSLDLSIRCPLECS
jgi:hypothetical protein